MSVEVQHAWLHAILCVRIDLLVKLLLNDASLVLRPCTQLFFVGKVALVPNIGGHPVLAGDIWS